MHAAYFRPGGVQCDLPAGLLSDIFIFVSQFKTKIVEIEEMLNENRIWKQRLVDVGVVTAKDAMDWGFSGVMLRGKIYTNGITIPSNETYIGTEAPKGEFLRRRQL